MTTHIMLDLETMGNSTNAAIVAIGAAAFDLQTGRIIDHLYRTVSLASSVRAGGAMDPDTVMWWLRQSDLAREKLQGPAVCIGTALDAFDHFCHEVSDGKLNDLLLWGNGADFDNAILAGAYRRSDRQAPWRYYNNRCYRTIKSMHPQIAMQRTGTHHCALDDAISQAKHLVAILSGGQP